MTFGGLSRRSKWESKAELGFLNRAEAHYRVPAAGMYVATLRDR